MVVHTSEEFSPSLATELADDSLRFGSPLSGSSGPTGVGAGAAAAEACAGAGALAGAGAGAARDPIPLPCPRLLCFDNAMRLTSEDTDTGWTRGNVMARRQTIAAARQVPLIMPHFGPLSPSL